MTGRTASARAPWSRLGTLLRRGVRTAAPLWPYYVIMYGIGVLHLVQVRWIDPVATGWVRSVTGPDLALFTLFEAPLYTSMEVLWTPRWVAAVSALYLVGFVGLLAWTPAMVAATGDRALLTRVLLTYPILYLIALPGYLLLPQNNPYVALELADPFSILSPDLERAYYLFTTPNNTFPSLHVAYTVALTAYLYRSRWTLLGKAAAVHGTLLVASVVYLRVHWVGDVLGGLVAAWLAIELADQAARRRGVLGGVVRRLDRVGRLGLARLLTRLRRGT